MKKNITTDTLIVSLVQIQLVFKNGIIPLWTSF